jgi:ParB family transcriptional regulator, chromosome partitioning protein
MPAKPSRLGRGLEALIAGAASARVTAADASPERPPPTPEPAELRISDIQPNRFQPRRDFDPKELTALENSLKASGLLQPITVRGIPDGRFELVAGERRLRAASRLGWTSIPAVVRDFDDQAMLVMALVENLQRADLNPLDEAGGYQRLIDEFALSQQQVADAVGKDRSTVANCLRILTLPDGIQRLVRDGKLSLGHARALLGVPPGTMIELARRVVDDQLTVRDVERIAQAQRPAGVPGKKGSASRASAIAEPGAASALQARRIAELLRRRLQTDVRINLSSATSGTVSINFYTTDDLQRIAEIILGGTAELG